MSSKLNTTADAILILLSLFYKEGDKNKWQDIGVFWEQSAFGRFKDEDGIEELFRSQMDKIYPHSIRKGGKLHRYQVKLVPRYDTTAGEHVYPALSRPLDETTTIRQHLSGSKLCFLRKASECKHSGYYHTGVMLRLNNVEHLVEVVKPNVGPATIGLTLYGQMREEQGAPQVDNSYLVHKGVDMHDIVYRTSLVLGVPICYDALHFNCDVVATWIVTGTTKWVTRTCLCATGKWIVHVLRLPTTATPLGGRSLLHSHDLDEAQHESGAKKLEVRSSWDP